jgi:hypothetical protein
MCGYNLSLLLVGCLLLTAPVKGQILTTNTWPNTNPALSQTSRYIVTLRRDADQDGYAREQRITRSRIFRHALNGFVADLDEVTAARLAADSRVLAIEKDKVAGRSDDQMIPTGVKRMAVDHFPAVNIDGTDKRIDADVAVIDSGIQTDHPDLNVVQAVDFTGEGSYGSNNHGTECAGIIGALDNNYGVVGVAPGVRLWSVRMIRENGTFFTSDAISAFDYVAAHADQIAVVNCSFNTFYGFHNLRVNYEQPITTLVNLGVVVVASAGNDGGDIAGPDGVLLEDGTFSDNSLPAGLPEVMAVSAMDPIADQLAGYSNFSWTRYSPGFVNSPGAAIDVAAPGNNVPTTLVGSAYTLTFTGTSAAAPHATGLVALYIAMHGRATNAAGVYAIRQAIIDAAQPQSLWQNTNTYDRDTNHEGLAVTSLSWVTNAPRLLNPVASGQSVNLRFTTLAGYNHTLQYSSSLNQNSGWADLAATNGTGAIASVNEFATNPARFYRLSTQPVPWPSFDKATAANLGNLGTQGDGTYLGASLGVPGSIAGDVGNSAIRLPTVYPGSRVQIPFQSGLNPSGPFSVEVWSRPAQTQLLSCVTASVDFPLQRSGWILYQTGLASLDGNGFSFRCYNSAGDAAVTIAATDLSVDTNTWYHLVGVFDGTNVSLYVNGVNVSSSALPGGQSFRWNPGAPLTFGVRSDGANWQNGDLDEGAFYTNSLTASQILAHYQAGTNSSPLTPYPQVILNDGPAGYWRFNEHQ